MTKKHSIIFFIFSSLLCMSLTTQAEPLKPWNHIVCGQQEIGANFLEVFIDEEGSLSAKTQASIYFAYKIPCAQISQKGPFFNCGVYENNESLNFNSFSLTKNGFPESYMNEEQSQVVEFHFKLNRGYRDASGNYQSKSSEFIFKEADCHVEYVVF